MLRWSCRLFAATLTPHWWWGAWLDPFTNRLLGTVAFMVAVGLLFSLPSIREGAKGHPELKEPEEPDDPYHGFWQPAGFGGCQRPRPVRQRMADAGC